MRCRAQSHDQIGRCPAFDPINAGLVLGWLRDGDDPTLLAEVYGGINCGHQIVGGLIEHDRFPVEKNTARLRDHLSAVLIASF
jgi:hypothetical protein